VVIPSLKVNYMYKFNKFSSSYTAEAMTILKALDLAMNEKWISINICSDSLSLLLELKTDLYSIFPFIKSNLNPTSELLGLYRVDHLK